MITVPTSSKQKRHCYLLLLDSGVTSKSKQAPIIHSTVYFNNLFSNSCTESANLFASYFSSKYNHSSLTLLSQSPSLGQLPFILPFNIIFSFKGVNLLLGLLNNWYSNRPDDISYITVAILSQALHLTKLICWLYYILFDWDMCYFMEKFNNGFYGFNPFPQKNKKFVLGSVYCLDCLSCISRFEKWKVNPAIY